MYGIFSLIAVTHSQIHVRQALLFLAMFHCPFQVILVAEYFFNYDLGIQFLHLITFQA